MCGILAIFGSSQTDQHALRTQARGLSNRMAHRGPDWCGTKTSGCNAIAHERLAIVDPESGEQPLLSPDGTVLLAANGEIYNHMTLKANMLAGATFLTGSDCEVIIPLYQKFGATDEGVQALCQQLDGDWAFALYDSTMDAYIVGRDPIGVNPLYMGWAEDGALLFASELKSLHDTCKRIQEFPPGYYYSSLSSEVKRWFQPPWLDPLTIPTGTLDLTELRQRFEAAVVKRMMSDVPWGVLLSGGLDSSLVAAIASRHAKYRTEGYDRSGASGTPRAPTVDAAPKLAHFPRLHSFCIGLKGSPDLAAAQQVADYLGTVHHPYTFTVADGIDAVSSVIRHLETFDVTTVRAATPMYLMCRKIKASGIKMVLSGEGADEVFGGYLYFHKAPSKEEHHGECVRKINDLHYYDCLRANKSTMAWGVEARVPFLDQEFLDYAMGLDPKHKVCGRTADGRIEKWVLRQAFDTPENPYLPKEVLWRQKEQFSDGVGYSWIDSLRDIAESEVSDAQLQQAKHRFTHFTPATKEAYYYRQIFEGFYPSAAAAECIPAQASVACSTAKAIEWDASFQALSAVNGECSGRSVVGVHDHAYTDVLAEVKGEGARQGLEASAAKKARVAQC
eukprot:COSAG05_NODE_159_length_15652_cov_14.134636_10_plen_618_part_00